MKKFFSAVSVIFHPMMMVTFSSLIYLFLIPSDFGFPDSSIPLRIIGMVITSTVLLPIVCILLMLRYGKIESVEMESQKERNWPLLLSAIIYLAPYYVLHSRIVPVFIQLFILGAIMGILIALVVNLKWKISLHMIGIGGLCGGISVAMMLQDGASPFILSACFIIAGLLGTARLYLQAHSPMQIFAGFATGFLVQFLLLFTMLS
ncbi:MAG TPA: PAP2 family protein [Bacteroidia bacterium]|nr:PAP2 family protein [Bacteroidia bacterium]